MDELKDVYLQRVNEISPNIRYCAYNIGDESAINDLMEMRLKSGQEDGLTNRLDVRLPPLSVSLSLSLPCLCPFSHPLCLPLPLTPLVFPLFLYLSMPVHLPPSAVFPHSLHSICNIIYLDQSVVWFSVISIYRDALSF